MEKKLVAIFRNKDLDKIIHLIENNEENEITNILEELISKRRVSNINIKYMINALFKRQRLDIINVLLKSSQSRIDDVYLSKLLKEGKYELFILVLRYYQYK